MSHLLALPLWSSDDVGAVRQVTRDAAREAGFPPLEQTKLATAASELARRALDTSPGSEVRVGIDTGPGGPSRLVVTVREGARPNTNGVRPGDERSRGRHGPGLDLKVIRSLVETFHADHDESGIGVVRVTATIPPTSPHTSDLAERIAAIRPTLSAQTLERRNGELADALTLLQFRSEELAEANAELQRVNAARAAVNAELALTNRGVLHLNVELERRAEELAELNESLAASATSQGRLAEQQAALADLGRFAVASRDPALISEREVATVRRVLEVDCCAVLRFRRGDRRPVVVASHGFAEDGTASVTVSRRDATALRRAGTTLIDLTSERSRFPLAVPSNAASGVVVAIPGPGEPWGLLVACDDDPARFSTTAMAFLEAAATLLGSSVARASVENAAVYAASHDALTGLPNRPQLLGDLADALQGAADRRGPAESGRQIAVIFIDLDGFKAINDTLGHAAGDVVLVETARRLRSLIRPADSLARLGGDEFVVLAGVHDEAGGATIAERLLSVFDTPFRCDGREVHLSGSAGFAVGDSETSASRLLADADLAMYESKKSSGSAVTAFHTDMRGHAEAEARVHSELRGALERRQLRAVYQPLVDLGSGRVCGVEALTRWRHPELGDVPASRTIATAERMGLAWELTRWILAEASETIAGWNAAHPDHAPLRLAINFTPLLFREEGLVTEFAEIVRNSGLPIDLLDVELTETAFADPTPELLQTIAEVRALGARLSMDDFGTGYSSLIALSNLPFDVLKIDRTFVSPLDQGGDKVLVRAMTGIARGRGLETVGEGIETAGQLAALIASECDTGQGYLFVRPLEKVELPSIVSLEARFVATIRAARLAALPARSGPVQRRDRPRKRPGARVLLVGDNPTDEEFLRVVLESAGHVVVPVRDARMFRRVIGDVHPDLVLLDVRLTESNGMGLVAETEDLLTMPVLAVTGYPDWVLESDVRSRYFAGVIPKPIAPDDLLARVEGALNADRAQVTADRQGGRRLRRTARDIGGLRDRSVRPVARRGAG